MIYPEALPITPSQVADAQAHLAAEVDTGHLTLENEVGFVVHHRVPDLEILYVCTWRGNNELWETLFTNGSRRERRLRSFSGST